MLLDSIYKTESSDNIDNLSGMAYINCQEETEIAPTVLWIRTRHSSASEQPCTLVWNTEKPGERFPVFLSRLLNTLIVHHTVIVHHITHEIFNNIMTITKMHKVIAFPCRF